MPCQIRMLEMNITQPCRPARVTALPRPLLHSRGQLLPGARTPRPERQGWHTPAGPRGGFKAVKFCILAPRPAPTAAGQLWTNIRPGTGDPSLQLGTKCKHDFLHWLEVSKNRPAACGVHPAHPRSLRPLRATAPALAGRAAPEALLLCVGSGRQE